MSYRELTSLSMVFFLDSVDPFLLSAMHMCVWCQQHVQIQRNNQLPLDAPWLLHLTSLCCRTPRDVRVLLPEHLGVLNHGFSMFEIKLCVPKQQYLLT